MRYLSSVRSRYLDIGQVLFFVFFCVFNKEIIVHTLVFTHYFRAGHSGLSRIRDLNKGAQRIRGVGAALTMMEGGRGSLKNDGKPNPFSITDLSYSLLRMTDGMTSSGELGKIVCPD